MEFYRAADYVIDYIDVDYAITLFAYSIIKI